MKMLVWAMLLSRLESLQNARGISPTSKLLARSAAVYVSQNNSSTVSFCCFTKILRLEPRLKFKVCCREIGHARQTFQSGSQWLHPSLENPKKWGGGGIFTQLFSLNVYPINFMSFFFDNFANFWDLLLTRKVPLPVSPVALPLPT